MTEPINPNTGRRTTTTPVSRGTIAYTAYGMQRNFVAINGDRMPTWNELRPELQAAWIAAAGAIWDIATTGATTLSRPDAP